MVGTPVETAVILKKGPTCSVRFSSEAPYVQDHGRMRAGKGLFGHYMMQGVHWRGRGCRLRLQPCRTWAQHTREDVPSSVKHIAQNWNQP